MRDDGGPEAGRGQLRLRRQNVRVLLIRLQGVFRPKPFEVRQVIVALVLPDSSAGPLEAEDRVVLIPGEGSGDERARIQEELHRLFFRP